MELILNLGCLETVGRKQRSYGLFLCCFCFCWVVRQLSNGKSQKSCGCQLFSEEHKQKLKDNRADFSGKNNPFYGKNHTEESRLKIGYKSRGRIVTERVREKISKANKGKLKGIKKSDKMKEKVRLANTGKKRTIEQRQKMSERQKGIKNPNWNEGSSFDPYSFEFNKEKKQEVLERDNYTCQDPNCDGNHKKLHVHHIDFDKKNNNPENLITLCNSCHSKTNGKNNRQFWIEFYQHIMMGKLMECFL